MVREFSAGGVVIRRLSGSWWIAAIEPEKEDSEPSPKVSSTGRRRLPRKTILALPKGLVDPGEKPEAAALREVQEETGAAGFMLQGSREIKPGLKDYDHLSNVLEALDF